MRTGELVIDGKTLEHVLGTPQEPLLAQLGSQCGSVVICRASPSQKAAIVRMMAEFEVASLSIYGLCITLTFPEENQPHLHSRYRSTTCTLLYRLCRSRLLWGDPNTCVLQCSFLIICVDFAQGIEQMQH